MSPCITRWPPWHCHPYFTIPWCSDYVRFVQSYPTSYCIQQHPRRYSTAQLYGSMILKEVVSLLRKIIFGNWGTCPNRLGHPDPKNPSDEPDGHIYCQFCSHEKLFKKRNVAYEFCRQNWRKWFSRVFLPAMAVEPWHVYFKVSDSLQRRSIICWHGKFPLPSLQAYGLPLCSTLISLKKWWWCERYHTAQYELYLKTFPFVHSSATCGCHLRKEMQKSARVLIVTTRPMQTRMFLYAGQAIWLRTPTKSTSKPSLPSKVRQPKKDVSTGIVSRSIQYTSNTMAGVKLTRLHLRSVIQAQGSVTLSPSFCIAPPWFTRHE